MFADGKSYYTLEPWVQKQKLSCRIILNLRSRRRDGNQNNYELRNACPWRMRKSERESNQKDLGEGKLFTVPLTYYYPPPSPFRVLEIVLNNFANRACRFA